MSASNDGDHILQETQDQKVSGEETRRIITECVTSIFNSSDPVSSNQAGRSSQPEVMLQFLHHCTAAFPQCYIAPCEIADNEELKQELLESKEFTRWIVGALLKILTSSLYETLHSKTEAVIIAVYKLLNEKNVSVFKEFVEELFNLMLDLSPVMQNMSTQEPSQTQTATIQHFKSGKSANKACNNLFPLDTASQRRVEISLNNISDCNRLAAACCHITKGILPGVCQFVGYTMDDMWSFAISVLSSHCLIKDGLEVIVCLVDHWKDFDDIHVVGFVNSFLSYIQTDHNSKEKLGLERIGWAETLKKIFNRWRKPDLNTLRGIIESLLSVKENSYKNNDETQDSIDHFVCVVSTICIQHTLTAELDIERHLYIANSFISLARQTDGNKSLIVAKEMIDATSKYFALKTKDKALSSSLALKETIDSLTNLINGNVNACKESLNDHSILVEHTVFRLKQIQNGLDMMSTLISYSNYSDTSITYFVSLAHFLLSMTSTIAILLDRPHSNIAVKALLTIYNSIYIVSTGFAITKDDKIIDSAAIDIASIPWLHSIDPPWLDYCPSRECSNWTKLSCYLEARNICLKTQSLFVLAYPQSKHCLQWRIHVFKSALESSDNQVQSAALKNVLVLIARCGRSGYSLIKDDMHALCRTKDIGIMDEVARVLFYLPCVLSGQCVVTTNSDRCSYACSACDKGTEKAGSIQEHMVYPFFQILKASPTSAIKVLILKGIDRIISHLSSSQDAVISDAPSWLPALQLLNDDDHSVRMKTSKTIALLVKGKANRRLQHLVVNTMREAFTQAANQRRVQCLETLALTVGSIGMHAEGDLFVVSIISLLECLLYQNQLVTAIAIQQMKKIMQTKKFNGTDVLLKCKTHVCEFLVSKLHHSLTENKDEMFVYDVFADVAQMLNYRDAKTFLQTIIKDLVPRVVKFSDGYASAFLKVLAKLSDLNHRELLFLNFKYVFSYLVRHSSLPELNNALNYFQTETDVELGSLLLSESQGTFNELLLHLSTCQDKVFQGLSVVASYDQKYTGDKDIITNQQMAAYLKPRLLGLLAHFNYILTFEDPSQKHLALNSLSVLMNIIDMESLTAVRIKLIGILKLGLQLEDNTFVDVSLKAWNNFVQRVDIASLGPLLVQICVILIPMLDKYAENVAKIFKYLFIQNRKHLAAYFNDIYFMPSLPELNDVNVVINRCQRQIGNREDLKTQLITVMKGVSQESVDVKRFALSKLIMILRSHKKYVHDFVLANEGVDPVIGQLIHTLIKCSKETNSEVQLKLAICFGELGAIDPGRLQLDNELNATNTNHCQDDVNDPGFGVSILLELCRSFRAAYDTRAQDCAAYAIQEMLRFYQCHNTDSSSAGYKIWHQLPDASKELLTPHLHSRYVISNSYDYSKLPKPIYGSAKGKTYPDWLRSLVGSLITLIDNKDASAVFRPFLSIIKYDVEMALFLLPRVTVYSLVSSKKAAEENLNEITTIVTAICSDKSNDASTILQLCLQGLFTLFDHLNNFIRQAEKNKSSNTALYSSENLSKVKDFLNAINTKNLAEASFMFNAHSRALLYLEKSINDDENQLEQELPFLQKIYFALGEPDAISGIAAIRKGRAALADQIVEHESQGRLREAAICYEKGILLESNNFAFVKGHLKCLIDLGQLNNALMNANGIMGCNPQWKEDLKPLQAEAAWRLGQWDSIAEETYKSLDNWSVSLGQLLHAVRNKDEERFEKCLCDVRCKTILPLSTASIEPAAFSKAYGSVLRLHMLQEVEDCASLVFHPEKENHTIQQFHFELEHRFELTQASFASREPVLSLRRTLFALLKSMSLDVSKEEDGCWLRLAKASRKAGHLQTAYSALLNITDNDHPDVIQEYAKWSWEQGDTHHALLSLQKGMRAWESSASSDLKMTNSKGFGVAKILLLIGRWMEHTERYEPETVLTQYKSVTSKFSDWEKGRFYLAKYYEKLMEAYDERLTKSRRTNTKGQARMRKADFIPFVVEHYGASLAHGSKFIYESMPKLLTLWLDFASQTPERDEVEYFKEKLNITNELIIKFSQKLPTYQFLTAFSQLISRISHPNKHVWAILEDIIARILVTYRQQAIWHMVAVSKSSIKTRKARCEKIFNKATAKDPQLKKFIEDSLCLTERFLEICNKKVKMDGKKARPMSMNKDFRILQKLTSNSNFSHIIVPLQSSLTVTLPYGHGIHSSHNPFPNPLPEIIGFADKVEVLHSLQKPKKINIKANDGKTYAMMCKPEDDLRKDCRLMEFNSLVNKLLMQDAACRERQLKIRTYAVIPLNERCGLLEWVENTSALLTIIDKFYNKYSYGLGNSELRQTYQDMEAMPIKEKVTTFKMQLLPRYPPVFHEWFSRVFTNPTRWYMARMAYCRTSAVMSMVGYALGLGDRHGGNILFDSTTGDCMHVDFNCLFNKGETFQYPERVPFRLTKNMIHAMGPLGYEGLFRRSCEVTLKVLRNQCDSLLSVLNTLIYDPLVEWKRERPQSQFGGSSSVNSAADRTDETSNEKAVKILKDVEQRLKGYGSSVKIILPLSIDGHVEQLIKEATSDVNLSQMFIGWAAYK